jgi:hypothetical protein
MSGTFFVNIRWVRVLPLFLNSNQMNVKSCYFTYFLLNLVGAVLQVNHVGSLRSVLSAIGFGLYILFTYHPNWNYYDDSISVLSPLLHRFVFVVIVGSLSTMGDVIRPKSE